MKQQFRDETLPIIRYSLSPQQQQAGKTFTQEQKWVISNIIEELLTNRYSIVFSPSDPMQGILQDAELRGAINILRELLLPAEFPKTPVDL